MQRAFKSLFLLDKWWAVYPPNSSPKCLIFQSVSVSQIENAPTKTPQKGWLSPDVIGHQCRSGGSPAFFSFSTAPMLFALH